jgi:hypothetical protein
MTKLAIKEELLDDLAERLSAKESEYDEIKNRGDH